jgi:hypothetical protein
MLPDEAGGPGLTASARAYELLCAWGEQFPGRDRRVRAHGDVTYRHPGRGVQSVAIDRLALAGTGQVYAGQDLRAPFGKYGTEPAAAAQAVTVLSRAFEAGALVWGFSGFATPGYSYAAEAQGMSALLGYLTAAGSEPALITDGGVSAGVLGLSGVLARRHGIPAMGFLPKQGLASFGPRDHLVVHMDTYPERERLVGTAPDVLVCVGGGAGTRRECAAALENGSTVILLALKDYGPASAATAHHEGDSMRSAARQGRLLRCHAVPGIPEAARLATAAAARFSVPARAARMTALAGLLAEKEPSA